MQNIIDEFISRLTCERPLDDEQVEVLRSLLNRYIALASSDLDVVELQHAAASLNELLDASSMFHHYAGRQKVAIFGSARTKSDSPLFALAMDFARQMAQREWMTICGAGGGIMEAAAIGAGIENTLGVNIVLPFEQVPSPHIDQASKLVTMNNFFTRKVALARPSAAFAAFPGGFGTLDELFEILTLLHTGKMPPAPVVLLDTPSGSFWSELAEWIENQVLTGGYIGATDLALVRFAVDAETAVDEILSFYSNYVSFEHNGARGLIETRVPLSVTQLHEAQQLFPVFCAQTGFSSESGNSFSFDFDGRQFVELRKLIDWVNQLI